MLKYNLVENLFTERSGDYLAQAVPMRSYTRNQIIEKMLRRGTMTTKTDIIAVINNLEETIAEILDEGGTIKMPLFNTSFSISGVFEGVTDVFDHNRHKLNINFTRGALLRNLEKKMRIEKTETVIPAPIIKEIKDFLSDTVNDTLTPGGVMQLWGYNLKIGGDHPETGLWFISDTGNSVKANIIVENKPTTIIAMIPDTLASGNYSIKLATQFSGGGILLKQPRISTFDKVLSIK